LRPANQGAEVLSERQTVVLATAHGRSIDADDVIALLREVYADGIAGGGEAEELIAFDQSLACSTADWQEFFAATVADHVVWREQPAGTVDERTASRLVDLLVRGRRAVTTAGFAAVLRVIETAHEVAPLLPAFAIEQVRTAVVTGDRRILGRHASLGRMIDPAETALLRRLLVAAGGAAGRPVSRAEAEAMFDLHDAVAGANNDAGFDDLFFKAIAHHLFAAAGCPLLPRDEMLLPDPRIVESGCMLGRASGRTGPAVGFNLPAGSIQRARLGPDDMAWLARQIMRDGRPTAAEFALLHVFGGAPSDAGPLVCRSFERAA
jgi:hypothetical protein